MINRKDIHESAYIDNNVSIGKNTKVWHFSHICENVKIGNDCIIGQNVMIGPEVKIGNKCKIQNNVSVFKGVQLGNGVFCGPSCVFTNTSLEVPDVPSILNSALTFAPEFWKSMPGWLASAVL